MSKPSAPKWDQNGSKGTAAKCTPKCSSHKGISRKSKRVICNACCDEHLGSYVNSHMSKQLAPTWHQHGSKRPPKMAFGASRGVFWASWGLLVRCGTPLGVFFIGGGLPTRHWVLVARFFVSFCLILGLLFGAFLMFFCCFATSRSGPPVGGQKGPWAATF